MGEVSVLFILVLVFGSAVASGCPTKCSCDRNNFTVFCKDFTLTWTQILNNIPASTRELHIQNSTILAEIPVFTRLHDEQVVIPQVVRSFPDFTKLQISSTKIDMKVTEDTFQPLKTTKELHLVYDSLEEIHDANIFNVLTNLQILNLSHNALSDLDDSLFQQLHQLKVLDLSFNKLNKLPHDIFEVMKGLESLHINDNALEYIHPHSIGNLTSLQKLHMDSNALETLHEDTFPENLSSITRLKLQGNPWDCNCGLVWLAKLLGSNATSSLFHDPESIQCYYPLKLRGMAIHSLSNKTLQCDLPVITSHPPSNISMQRMRSHSLQCNATGYPSPSIYWLTPNGVMAQPSQRKYISPDILELAQKLHFRGIPIYVDSSLEVMEDGTLYFHQVRWYYAGEYACVAENPGGTTVYKFHIKVFSTIRTFAWTGMAYGGIAALAFFVLSMIYASVKLLIEKTCCRKRMQEKADSIISSIEEESNSLFLPDSPLFEGYLSPDWSKDFYISPRYSPAKCVTPSEDFDTSGYRAHIKDTLEDVRVRLHKGVEKQKDKIRTRAQRVKESSSQYMQSIKETGTIKMQTIKESSSQYVKTIRSSGTQAVQSIRSSSSQYAHRVRAGVVMGVEHVKYHMQSVKEFCGTGDIGQTISTVSMSTNVDIGERTEVVKQITYV